MIHSTIRMAIPSAKVAEVLGILGPMAERIGVDPGCLGCHVYMDAVEKNVVMFEQRWRSEDDLTRHLRSSDYQSVLILMETALAQPEVRFDAISHTTGLDTIQLARG